MKIALLGAPGSNKSEVAKRLARNLNRDHEEHWSVVDGYVDHLTSITGQKYGPDAHYAQNAQIMCERWTREAQAMHKGDSTITCGSIYETIIHAATIGLVPPADEQALLIQRDLARIAMEFFGAMETLAFDYDILFYLPLENREDHSWEAVIDAKLPEVIEAYFKQAVELTGTIRQKVTDALEITRLLRETYKEVASLAERSATDGSGAPSEAAPDQPQAVSDMS